VSRTFQLNGKVEPGKESQGKVDLIPNRSATRIRMAGS
jgi:hypothetical protein